MIHSFQSTEQIEFFLFIDCNEQFVVDYSLLCIVYLEFFGDHIRGRCQNAGSHRLVLHVIYYLFDHIHHCPNLLFNSVSYHQNYRWNWNNIAIYLLNMFRLCAWHSIFKLCHTSPHLIVLIVWIALDMQREFLTIDADRQRQITYLTSELLKATHRFNLRGAIEFIRERIKSRSSSSSFTSHPSPTATNVTDKPMQMLLNDREFYHELSQAALSNQNVFNDVQRSVMGLYHLLSKYFHS